MCDRRCDATGRACTSATHTQRGCWPAHFWMTLLRMRYLLSTPRDRLPLPVIDYTRLFTRSIHGPIGRFSASWGRYWLCLSTEPANDGPEARAHIIQATGSSGSEVIHPPTLIVCRQAGSRQILHHRWKRNDNTKCKSKTQVTFASSLKRIIHKPTKFNARSSSWWQILM